jgi:hypothetical protein
MLIDGYSKPRQSFNQAEARHRKYFTRRCRHSALANNIMNIEVQKRTIWISCKESKRLPVGQKQRRRLSLAPETVLALPDGKLTDHQKKTLRTSCTYMAIRIPSPSDLARVAMAIRAWPLLYAARARNKLNPIDRA